LLHTLRRRAALRRLAHRRLSGTVLFVCLGNICRSPYAAATFSQGLGVAWRGRVRVDSAGFLGPGRSAPGHAVEVAADRGIDLSGHRSRLVSPEMWAGAELVVVMEPGQQGILEALFGRGNREIVILGDLDPQAVGMRAIADPVGQPKAAFEESYARIDRCVGELVKVLSDVGGEQGRR
jgi:protein-tyrosine phosphatase